MESVHHPDVIFTDFVDDEILSHLYSRARLFVFPSLSEGFGLPPLEAFVHGVPVASSNRTCLPEILGEGALYFDPENISQMKDVICAGLKDEDIRFTLQENAKLELIRYSWERTARETLGIYTSAML